MTTMQATSPQVANISDTALWVAYFRDRETQRPDALFRDPFAGRLAGERGFQIANSLQDGTKHEWAWVARTYLFDQFVQREIQQGSDLVVNLAAGLDTRPYRLQLPPTLKWVEVDLPELVCYKEEILKGERPACELRRFGLDLSDTVARRKLFSELKGNATRITVMAEGLLIYLAPEEVSELARDLAAELGALAWIIDLASPGQLKLMQRTMGKQLSEAGAAFQFAPVEGPDFFVPHGWEPIEIRGFLRTAAQLNRAPVELLSLLPEPKEMPRNYPWTGVCLLKKR